MEKDFVKITNAAYKVLDFLPESDPLKNKAKQKALEILEGLMMAHREQGWVSLKHLLSPKSLEVSVELLDNIEILENYLVIAKGQGWISGANFLIITKEYSVIKNNITLPRGLTLEHSQKESRVKTNQNPPPLSVVAKINPTQQERSLPKVTPRQKKILEILAKTKKAQVSDFIKELPDVTKRTIRRDLDELLKSGNVVRRGEFNQVFYQPAQSI